MSNNPLAMIQQGGQLVIPAAFAPLMNQTTASEMQANVGASFAVIGIKGKTFTFRYGGKSDPLMVNMGGALYPAPYLDVVIVRGRAELSKTYYPDGYKEGDDQPPTCWSEDGVTPLSPMEQRPIDPRTSTPCIDCRMCPMNQFGSKVSETGGRGKACADTRKVLVYPMKPTGQKNADGSDVTMLDHENIKYGGGMLLRIPAASLRVFAEYDAKLQAMGVPYYAVVTRLQFDPAEAFPKFMLAATRVLAEFEAQHVVELREGMQAKQILESGQVGAPPPGQAALPAPAVAAVAGQQTPAVLQPAAPVQPAVTPVQPVVATAAPVQPVTTIAQPAAPMAPPAPPAPPAAPPVAAVWPPEGWTLHPDNPAYFYRGSEVKSEAELRAMAPAAPAIVPPTGPAPAAQPQLSSATFATVDSLLNS